MHAVLCEKNLNESTLRVNSTATQLRVRTLQPGGCVPRKWLFKTLQDLLCILHTYNEFSLHVSYVCACKCCQSSHRQVCLRQLSGNFGNMIFRKLSAGEQFHYIRQFYQHRVFVGRVLVIVVNGWRNMIMNHNNKVLNTFMQPGGLALAPCNYLLLLSVYVSTLMFKCENKDQSFSINVANSPAEEVSRLPTRQLVSNRFWIRTAEPMNSTKVLECNQPAKPPRSEMSQGDGLAAPNKTLSSAAASRSRICEC